MNAPSVTPQQIADLIKGSAIEIQTIFGKVTLVCARLESGFVVTASSGAVSKENYDEKIGAEICMKQIEDQLWKLEGYALQKMIHAGADAKTRGNWNWKQPLRTCVKCWAIWLAKNPRRVC